VSDERFKMHRLKSTSHVAMAAVKLGALLCYRLTG